MKRQINFVPICIVQISTSIVPLHTYSGENRTKKGEYKMMYMNGLTVQVGAIWSSIVEPSSHLFVI